MYGVIIALLPALLVSFWFFGIGSAIVCATSVVACVFFEWAINKYILKNERNTIMDGSAALTGLLLGMNLPSNLPIWIIIIGALFAIGVAKMTFGGLGNNLFNPALVGRCACSDDNLAENRTTLVLSGRRDGCYAADHHAGCHQTR